VSLGQAAAAAALAFTDGLSAILVLSAVIGAGTAVSQPAEFALMPAVVGEGDRTEANGRLESARYVGFTAGPLLGGVLAGGGGLKLAMLVNAASFLFVAGAALSLRARRPRSRCGRVGGRDRACDGFAFLSGDAVLRVVVGAAVLGLLFMSASIAVEVFYVKDVIGAGDLGYAVTTAAWTAGMVAGASGLAARMGRDRLAAAALAALVLQGAGMALAASWPALPVAVAGFAFGGVAHGVKNVLIRTLILERTPDRLHGRAFAAYNAARNTAELGALAAGGLLVSILGAQLGLFLAGLGPVVVGLAALAALHRRASRVEPARPAAGAEALLLRDQRGGPSVLAPGP
jgi:Na+/melibiose symporter-like transporter